MKIGASLRRQTPYEPITYFVPIAGGRTHSVATLADDTLWTSGLNNVNRLTSTTASQLPGLLCMPMQLDMDVD